MSVVETSSSLDRLIEDFRCHGSSLSSPGFRALITYRFGVWRKRIRFVLLRRLLRPVYVMLHRRMRNRYGIELHYTSQFGRRLRLSDQGDIVIGNPVRIGDDCRIGRGVTIGKISDEAVGWPRIGNGVVIGPGAVIIGNIDIGDGAVIGPNTVVLTNVPRGGTVSARSPEISCITKMEHSPNKVEPQDFGPDHSPLASIIREDRRCYGEWSSRGFRTIAVYRLTRHASGRTSIASRIWLGVVRLVEGMLRRRSQIELPTTAVIGRRLHLAKKGRICVAAGSVLGDDCSIEEGVTIGWWAGPPGVQPRVVLGRGVHIAAGAVVHSGVVIGDHVRIGLNAVVTEDVPDGSRVEAPKARLIRPMKPAQLITSST